MSILTVADALAQCRLESDYPVDQLQPYIDGAEAAACAYLNRSIYPDEESLMAAQDAAPSLVGNANAAYQMAMAAAQQIEDPLARATAVSVAETRLADAQRAAKWAVFGIVANASVISAMRLTLGHLFTNRESVIAGSAAAAVALPQGAEYLLGPHRRVMMP